MHERSALATLMHLQGDLRVDMMTSSAIAGNALGDSPQRPVAVYLPPGYDESASRRYPVLYLLHGYTGNVGALLSTRPWETNAFEWIDRLITGSQMRPAILVAVDGFTRLGGSQYVDSVHNGNYTTYVVEEVVPHVDLRYRTIAAEGGRAALGKSSGGFGAMHLTMERPGTFAAFASHSGDAYFRYAHPPAFVHVQRTLERHNGDIAAFVDSFERRPKRSQPEYATMEMLGYAAAYSPRSGRPFDLELPFDARTGELDEAVFSRWLQFDPAERVASRVAQLGRLRLRYLDCGRRDEYALDIGARVTASRMRDVGLDVRHEEFDDDHRNINYRYAISLPALTAVLDAE